MYGGCLDEGVQKYPGRGAYPYGDVSEVPEEINLRNRFPGGHDVADTPSFCASQKQLP
jgi:hypothetical protein